MSFSYKPGSLRIDCNEVGFNAENVEAICAISRSTKSGKTSDGEYIGEKGIGFKSVFKVADVVWISSRDFTFKFDKTKFLGMVAPVWETFPEKTQPGCTSIYLQLSKGYYLQVVVVVKCHPTTLKAATTLANQVLLWSGDFKWHDAALIKTEIPHDQLKHLKFA